ncbi:unnamed protein product [Miscanthus lutarioriparius]|uniref:Uncharacterized protein n=1 Tax=Miscanthus lutarioriparius TaxID=422564 RepID=A0A811MZ07_9POAL|nr:unnamed protein product [Miscanthus lutarioriparius]
MEEDKVEFRALKLKFATFYRRMTTTKPVFRYINHPAAQFPIKQTSTCSEKHLIAEEVERQSDISRWPIYSHAQHFAILAFEWYNSTKKTVSAMRW